MLFPSRDASLGFNSFWNTNNCTVTRHFKKSCNISQYFTDIIGRLDLRVSSCSGPHMLGGNTVHWATQWLRLTKAPSTPATMSKLRSTSSKQHSTLLPKTATKNVGRVYRKISSFQQCRMLLRHCCRFWQRCQIKSNQIYLQAQNMKKKTNWTCFDCVERTKFRSTLLPKMATTSKQRSTLWKESFDLQHSTMLLFDIVAGVDKA